MIRTILAAVTAGLVLVALSVTPVQAQQEKHSVATLHVEASQLPVGESMQAVVKLELEPGWHVYWKNPGDSGLEASIKAQDNAVSVGTIEWLPPKRVPLEPLMNFGYEGTVYYPFQVTLNAANTDGAEQVPLQLSWLECHDVCLTRSEQLPLSLSQGERLANESDKPALDAAKAQLAKVQNISGTIAPLGKNWLIKLDKSEDVKDAYFFPENNRLIRNATPQHIVAHEPIQLRVERLDENKELTDNEGGIVELTLADGSIAHLAVTLTPAKLSLTERVKYGYKSLLQ